MTRSIPGGLVVRLAAQALGRRPLRLALLVLTVALAVGTVLAAAVARRAVQDSLGMGVARLGADLIVVPRQTLVNLVPALLVAEPTPHTLAASVADEIRRVPGVEAVAAQRVFTLAEATGSEVPDVVAFDPALDFTVLPWLRDRLPRPFGRGDALVGARRPEQIGASVRLGGRALTVYGRLEPTRVGLLDRAVVASFETVEALGPTLFAGAGTHPSALLVRLAPGGSLERVRFALASDPAVKVVAGAPLATSLRQTLTVLLGAAAALILLVLAAAVAMIGLLYSVVLVERRRELGVLLVVGARRRQIVSIVAAEAMLATAGGGVAGVVLGAGALLALERSLGHHLASLDIALAWPGPLALALHAVLAVGVASGVGLAGVLVPALRLSRREPYDLVRGEAG